MSFIYRIIPKTLLLRFMLIITVPTIIAQMLIVVLFYDRHWYNISYYSSNLISNEIKLLITSYENNDLQTQGILRDYFNFTYQFHPNMELQRKQPRIQEELEIFKTILTSKIKNKNIVKLNRDKKIEVFFKFETGVMQITFASKLLINKNFYIFVLSLVILTILLLAVSLLFARKQINTILELAHAADAFGKGVKSANSYKPSGASEIRRAGLAFIRMKERIERQIIKRTQMLAMMSHDLRTPLTRMKLQLALMDIGEEKNELNNDIDSMEQMIKSYLDFSRGESVEPLEEINLGKWLNQIITSRQLGIVEFIDSNTPVLAKIKPFTFSRAIYNLLDNSIKYATKSKCLLSFTEDFAIITIEDNGSGIKDEEKSLVFRPFYRSDKARNLDQAGNVGLGLAIVQEIVTNHDGKISLEDSKALGGLLVRISLPLIKCKNNELI